MSDDENKRDGERTTADLLRDPETAQRMYEQRLKYFNDPRVQHALAIEKAEKIKPKGKPN